jgi:hypothetical protein
MSWAVRKDNLGVRAVSSGAEIDPSIEIYSTEYPELSKPLLVPESVTMMQARLAMLNIGILDDVISAIAAMTGDEGKEAQIQWEYAMDVRRDWPLVSALGSAMSLTDKQIDDLFMAAGAIQ